MVRFQKAEEPKYEGTLSQLQLLKCLNWYHENKENKDAVKYIQDYCKKNRLSGKLDTSKSFLTMAWLCRAEMNGNDLGKYGKKYITDQLKHYLQVEKVVKAPVVDVVVPNIQDRLKEKVSEIAGDLEGAIDDYIASGYKDTKSPFAMMQDRAKGIHANRIVEIFKKRRNEFDEVLNTKDSDIKEGYSNFSKTQLKKLIAYCDTIITDALKISGESKATRKPRKRKVKTPDQLVSKLQYLSECKEFKLKSITPKQIIGAMQLWVFNVKTRSLGVYHAEDASGFSVKGSTLLNFAESKSVTKRLRKPEQTLPEVMSAGKVALRNLLGKLSTKESLLTGRINKDTIMLRII
jgi:hypothetical protein